VKGTVAGVTTTYVGGHYEVQGSTTRKYYYLGAQRVAMLENSTVYYILGDHLGSTSLIVNSTAGLYGENRYKAFGETRYTSGTIPTTFGFTGQRQESGLGLYFYNARWYDPALGRFIQADTIVPSPADPQSWNRYSYALNNPLTYTDPSGHASCSIMLDGEVCYTPAPGAKLPKYESGAVTPSGNGGSDFSNLYTPIVTNDLPKCCITVAEPDNGPKCCITISEPDNGPRCCITIVEPVIGLGCCITIVEEISGLKCCITIVERRDEGPRIIAANGKKTGFPPIKDGTAGGPTSGKDFPDSVREQAFAENPLKICVFCHMPGTATHVDHAFPKSKGGDATIDNAQLACPHCNTSRQNGDYPKTPPSNYVGPWPPPWWPG
jgi:RHS repeat-associated protein